MAASLQNHSAGLMLYCSDLLGFVSLW